MYTGLNGVSEGVLYNSSRAETVQLERTPSAQGQTRRWYRGGNVATEGVQYNSSKPYLYYSIGCFWPPVATEPFSVQQFSRRNCATGLRPAFVRVNQTVVQKVRRCNRRLSGTTVYNRICTTVSVFSTTVSAFSTTVCRLEVARRRLSFRASVLASDPCSGSEKRCNRRGFCTTPAFAKPCNWNMPWTHKGQTNCRTAAETLQPKAPQYDSL